MHPEASGRFGMTTGGVVAWLSLRLPVGPCQVHLWKKMKGEAAIVTYMRMQIDERRGAKRMGE